MHDLRLAREERGANGVHVGVAPALVEALQKSLAEEKGDEARGGDSPLGLQLVLHLAPPHIEVGDLKGRTGACGEGRPGRPTHSAGIVALAAVAVQGAAWGEARTCGDGFAAQSRAYTFCRGHRGAAPEMVVCHAVTCGNRSA